MLRHNGGHQVGKGTYWNFSTGERLDVETEAVLPGGSRTTYYRLPATGFLLLGPFLGLLYAVFLPFIGIAMAVKVVLQKIGVTVTGTARTGASFGWRPSESYLAGKRKKEKSEDEAGKGRDPDSKE